MLEVLSSGLMNSVQDLGRPGLLDQGVGRGGAMDRDALILGNLMVGNPVGAAGLEISVFPFRLRFHGSRLFAVAGAEADVMLDGAPLHGWWARVAKDGDELRIDAPAKGARVMICFSGGVDAPEILASRATDLKSGFGGFQGRALARGDRLALGEPTASSLSSSGFGLDCAALGRDDLETLRVMAGGEYAAFEEEARHALIASAFPVSRENNRQGMRLEGPLLKLSHKLELHSHGIMPGTVQVPPSGAPVIQLAEANTCGGYPKIAHVIGADHWKLAQARTGAALRFKLVSRSEAVLAEREAKLRREKIAHLAPLALNRIGKSR